MMMMTVEELIIKLQQVKDKKNRIVTDTPSSGTLLYRNIHDIQITELNGFTVIELIRE